MKNFLKSNKGEYGYISDQRKKEIIKTLLLFALCASIYITGYITTGSNKNLLTIVAILGCLPASKSAVSMIMFIKSKGCTEELHRKIAAKSKGLPQLYDNVLTSYQNTFEISHFAYRGNNLIGITENPKCKVAEAEKHVLTMCAQDGIKEITVKIFNDPAKYLSRLEQLCELENEDGAKTEAVLALIKVLSI